jgi:hypothetical protein
MDEANADKNISVAALSQFHDPVPSQRSTSAAEAEVYIGFTAGLKACSTPPLETARRKMI